MPDKEHELTEKLKALETKIYNAKIDLSGINRKLESSYSYEDELMDRQVTAKNQTKEIRIEFFQKSSEITEMYNKIKKIVDVFTGNFHNDVKIK